MMIGLMYYFSTDVLSGENTRSVIEKIAGWFTPHVSARTVQKLNFWVRKTAHFTEYATLACLLFRAFRADSLVAWKLRWAVYSLVVCVNWALLDELHQTFTRTRGGSINDSLLDSTGAIFALIVIALFGLRRSATKASVET